MAAVFLLPPPAAAQEEGYEFRLSNISLELLGGYARVRPDDFNEAATYEQAYLRYYYVTRFDYYRSLYGDNYRVTSDPADAARFNLITGSSIYGARLRYQLSSTLGLSFGVQYLSRTQASNVAMNVDVVDASRSGSGAGAALSFQYQNPAFLLAVSAWSPQLAAHFGWDIGRVLRLEVLIAGGPLYVECRTVSERRLASADPEGFRTETVTAVEMKGEAKGLCGELGGRAGLRLAKFLTLFAEAGFTFRSADEVKGPGSSRTAVSDSDGGDESVTASWSGKWGFFRQRITSDWGQFQEYQLQNQNVAIYFGSGFKKFTIDLSGFQLKAGLGFRI